MNLKIIKKKFDKYGYVKISNVINKEEILRLQKTIYYTFQKYKSFKIKKKLFDNTKFHEALITLRKDNPDSFGSFYDTIQSSINLYNIVTNKKLINIVSKISGLNKESLSFNGENVRMDGPNDKKNSLGWHQDRAYYFQNRDGNKGLICWIPLLKIFNELGPLEICESSAKDGFIKVPRKKYKKKRYSPQFKINERMVKNYKKIRILADVGDILLLNKNTIHKSGKNSSKKFRFSLQIRFHDMSDKNYLPHKNTMIYNKYEINKMKNNSIDISDIQF
jgi:ectoine hydroxylase-related dioxygenase (phytanoyl-CoA dioxygenase family)